MKEGGALYFVFRESRSPGCSPSRTRAVRSDFLVRPAPFSPLVLYGALSSSHQLLALRASVSGLTFSPLVLYGALSSSHQHRSSSNPFNKECNAGRGIWAASSLNTTQLGHRWNCCACSQFLNFAPVQIPFKMRVQCRERDLNPHGNYFPTDFKSVASAIPPSRRIINYYNAYFEKIEILEFYNFFPETK